MTNQKKYCQLFIQFIKYVCLQIVHDLEGEDKVQKN